MNISINGRMKMKKSIDGPGLSIPFGAFPEHSNEVRKTDKTKRTKSAKANLMKR